MKKLFPVSEYRQLLLSVPDAKGGNWNEIYLTFSSIIVCDIKTMSGTQLGIPMSSTIKQALHFNCELN